MTLPCCRDRRQTALFFAVYNDSEEATELLLEAGANTELDYVKVFRQLEQFT